MCGICADMRRRADADWRPKRDFALWSGAYALIEHNLGMGGPAPHPDAAFVTDPRTEEVRIQAPEPPRTATGLPLF